MSNKRQPYPVSSFHTVTKLEIYFHIKNHFIASATMTHMDHIEGQAQGEQEPDKGYLVEEEAVVDLVEKEHHEDQEAPLVLVEKIMGSRDYMTEIVRKVLEKAWRLPWDFKVKGLTANVFKFTFEDPFDMHKVKENAQCLINQYLLALNYWLTNMLLKDMDFTRSPC